MTKRKAQQDPVSDDEQQQDEEQEDVEQHDASVNGTRHKLQPDKLRMYKEQADRKGAVDVCARQNSTPPTQASCTSAASHRTWYEQLHARATSTVSLQKPAKLRHLLEKHGTVTRIYCAPEGLRGYRLCPQLQPL